MPLENNATLSDVIQAQNEFIAEQTQKIATLEQNNATALQNLSALGQRVYGYNHESFAVKDIETVYYDIIAANPELESKHAIGFTALLKDGETVSKQGNIMYINGEEETEDYTFSGTNTSDSNEFVIVWYFSNNGAVNFAESDMSILELAVIRDNSDTSTLNLGTNYYEQIETLIGYDFYPPTSTYAKKVEINMLDDHELIAGSIGISAKNKYFKSDAKKMAHTSAKPFTSSNTAGMKIFDFPELEEIRTESHTGTGPTFDLGGNSAQIKMPKLKKINFRDTVFKNVIDLELPETLVTVETSNENTISMIDSVQHKLTLNCIYLERMTNKWYKGTAPNELEIKAGWSGTINLAVAGANMTEKSWWVDLFENKLADVSSLTPARSIKIPATIYSELTAEEIAIATDKGWTFGN